ncbi:hypothetical protein EB118_01955 [bacterium]|nr:hypothetical protein [bacterium]NDD83013.1 hypothetical protein [bacterium]NDG28851.1 hypothetical protein [bacterium]
MAMKDSDLILYGILAIFVYFLFFQKDSTNENFETPQNIYLNTFYMGKKNDPRFKARFKDYSEFYQWFMMYDDHAYREAERVRNELLQWHKLNSELRTQIKIINAKAASAPAPAHTATPMDTHTPTPLARPMSPPTVSQPAPPRPISPPTVSQAHSPAPPRPMSPPTVSQAHSPAPPRPISPPTQYTHLVSPHQTAKVTRR